MLFRVHISNVQTHNCSSLNDDRLYEWRYLILTCLPGAFNGERPAHTNTHTHHHLVKLFFFSFMCPKLPKSFYPHFTRWLVPFVFSFFGTWTVFISISDSLLNWRWVLLLLMSKWNRHSVHWIMIWITLFLYFDIIVLLMPITYVTRWLYKFYNLINFKWLV